MNWKDNLIIWGVSSIVFHLYHQSLVQFNRYHWFQCNFTYIKALHLSKGNLCKRCAMREIWTRRLAWRPRWSQKQNEVKGKWDVKFSKFPIKWLQSDALQIFVDKPTWDKLMGGLEFPNCKYFWDFEFIRNFRDFWRYNIFRVF